MNLLSQFDDAGQCGALAAEKAGMRPFSNILGERRGHEHERPNGGDGAGSHGAGGEVELAAMELQLAAMKLAAMAVMELAAMELAITLHGS